MSTSQLIFSSIVGVVAVQRIFAIRTSKKNAKYLESIGGKKRNENLLWWVKVLQISWFIGMLVEVYGFHRPFIPQLAIAAFLITIISQILRYLSMGELGHYWTHTVITLPGKPVVNTGVYRYLKHPTWLAMSLEFASLPLIHTAYVTAIIVSIINIFIMSKRIPVEEKALIEDTNYGVVFNDVPRLIPLFFRKKTNLIESN